MNLKQRTDGARAILEYLREKQKLNDTEVAINQLYPNGITEEELNNILCFTKYVYSILDV